MKERWLPIKGYEGSYEISEFNISISSVCKIKSKSIWKHITKVLK